MAESPTLKAEPSYEQRLILFIDFLGFKEIVEGTETHPAALRRLIDALDEIGEMGGSYGFESQRVTQFSDSIVLSYAANEESGAFWMIQEIALTVITLVMHGYLMRGAVTIGSLYHADRHVVGPAMNQAYEMESKQARFPRVIVDPAVIQLARRHHRDGHTPNEEESYVRSFIVDDADGHLFIDYVGWDAVVEGAGLDNEGYPEYLARLSSLIEKGLTHKDPRVLEKYLWLHPRYVSVLNRFKSLPADHPYRRESWENCEAIETLPDLLKLAANAQIAVDAATKENEKRS